MATLDISSTQMFPRTVALTETHLGSKKDEDLLDCDLGPSPTTPPTLTIHCSDTNSAKDFNQDSNQTSDTIPEQNIGFWNSVKNYLKKFSIIRHIFCSKPEPIKTQAEVDREVESKFKQIAKDLGLEETYNRTFLSATSDIKPRYEINFKHSDPAILMIYILLNIHQKGDENCKEAFLEWEKINARMQVKTEEKREINNKTADLESSMQKYSSLIKTGLAIGSVAIVAAGGVVGIGILGVKVFSLGFTAKAIAGTTAALGGVISVAKNIFLAYPAATMAIEGVNTAVNITANNAISKNKANVEFLTFETNQIQSMSSMVAQDLSRLYQTQSSLMNMIQACIQSRKEHLAAVGYNIR